jgi:hypothetical protein
LRAVDTAEAIGLRVMRAHIEAPLAVAEAKLGDVERAVERLERGIRLREDYGLQGVALGWVYEVRARIALWMDDPDAFERYAQLCARQYNKSGGDPALAAKYERLMTEARQRGVATRVEIGQAVDRQATAARTQLTVAEEAARAIRAALEACGSRAERIVRALELLTSGASAVNAELYLVEHGALVVAATTAAGLGAETRTAALARLLQVGGDESTVMTDALALQGPSQPDGSETAVWPMLLAAPRAGKTAAVGVVALHFAAHASVRLPLEVATAVALALIDAGDVEPQMLGDIGATARDT